MRKYAARPNLARVLCDYIMYVVSCDMLAVLRFWGRRRGLCRVVVATQSLPVEGCRQHRMAAATGLVEGAFGCNTCSHSHDGQQPHVWGAAFPASCNRAATVLRTVSRLVRTAT